MSAPLGNALPGAPGPTDIAKMTKNTLTLLFLLLFTVACFAAGIALAWMKAKKTRRKRSVRGPETFPLSAFSTFDHPVLRGEQATMSPLAEAEVLMVYGKKRQAVELLELAVRTGRISQGDADAFWSRY